VGDSYRKKHCQEMALSTQESDEDKSYGLVARMDNARNMITILKAIHFKDVRNIYLIAILI
jgi:hypothetical protein